MIRPGRVITGAIVATGIVFLAFGGAYGIDLTWLKGANTKEKAMADVARTALHVHYLDRNPYQLRGPVDRGYDVPADICTAENIREGLTQNACRPARLSLCGRKCFELHIDTKVYAAAGQDLRNALRDPCALIAASGYTDGRERPPTRQPSYYYFPIEATSSALWCRWPFSIGARSVVQTDHGIRVEFGFITGS